jgi:hypothetical protein
MTDTQYIFNLKSGTSDGEILFNGESKGYSPKTILLTLKEVQDNYNGRVEITFKKTNYVSTTRYELTLGRNPAYDSFVLSQQLAQQLAQQQQQFQQSGDGFDPTSDNTAVYSNIPQFILKVNKYENNDLQEFNQDFNTNLIDLDFNLNAEQSQSGATGASNGNEDDDTDVVGFKVALNGLLSSAKFIVNGTEQILIDKTGGVYNFKLGDNIEITSSDLTKFKITEIVASGIDVDVSRKAETDEESLRFKITVNRPLAISITTAEVFSNLTSRPSITLLDKNDSTFGVLEANKNKYELCVYVKSRKNLSNRGESDTDGTQKTNTDHRKVPTGTRAFAAAFHACQVSSTCMCHRVSVFHMSSGLSNKGSPRLQILSTT